MSSVDNCQIIDFSTGKPLKDKKPCSFCKTLVEKYVSNGMEGTQGRCVCEKCVSKLKEMVK